MATTLTGTSPCSTSMELPFQPVTQDKSLTAGDQVSMVNPSRSFSFVGFFLNIDFCLSSLMAD
jgi:hypothetical protein